MFFEDEGDSLDLNLLGKALRGLSLWRPMVIFALAIFLGEALFLGFSWMGDSGGLGGVLLSLIGALLMIALVGAGYLGAGHCMAWVAQGQAQPSVLANLRFGLLTLPKFIGLFAIEFLLVFGVLVVETVVVEICRIPILGGLLSLVVFPGLFLLNVVLLLGAFVIFNLSGPALWFGESLSGAFRHVVHVARSRPGPVILMLLLLTLTVALLTLIIVAVAGYSLGITTMLANLLPSSPLGLTQQFFSEWTANSPSYGGYGMSDMAGYRQSFNAGLYPVGGVLALLAFAGLVVAIPNNVLLLGLAHIYHRSASLVDAEDNRGAPAAPPPVVAQPSPTPSPRYCRYCAAPLQAGDRFCSECGKPAPE